jgi:hypothetical protein
MASSFALPISAFTVLLDLGDDGILHVRRSASEHRLHDRASSTVPVILAVTSSSAGTAKLEPMALLALPNKPPMVCAAADAEHIARHLGLHVVVDGLIGESGATAHRGLDAIDLDGKGSVIILPSSNLKRYTKSMSWSVVFSMPFNLKALAMSTKGWNPSIRTLFVRKVPRPVKVFMSGCMCLVQDGLHREVRAELAFAGLGDRRHLLDGLHVLHGLLDVQFLHVVGQVDPSVSAMFLVS